MKKIFLVFLAVLMVFLLYGFADLNPRSQIKGMIVDVKMYPSQSFLGMSFTAVEFKDGRTIQFRGIYYGISFQKGKCYTITYDKWSDRIIRVDECDTE